MTLRLTAAAVASYVVAHAMFPASDALLAPLTALLVVQLTPVSLLTSGVQRVMSVVAGVSLAVVFSSLLGLSWWSLAALIGLSLLIGQALRLGPNQLEVPISAMLVLGAGVGGAEMVAWQRITETLVGAGVGVLSNLLFPPRIAIHDADSAIQRFLDDLARLLGDAADDLDGALDSDDRLTDRTSRWLGEVRRLTHTIPTIGSALLRAEESRRLNVRALGTADVAPGLRHGVEALEHSAVALRSMFRSLDDAGRRRESREAFSEDLELVAVGLLLHEMASAVRSFGWLVQAEAQRPQATVDLSEARQGLEELREARARLTELLMIDRRDDATFAELNFALLTTVERLLRELNLEDRIRSIEQRPPAGPRRIVPRVRRGGFPPESAGRQPRLARPGIRRPRIRRRSTRPPGPPD